MESSTSSATKFCLRWNNFGVNVSSSFRTLLKCDTFADVSLVTSASLLVKAHRLVLSASSPFFEDVLKRMDEWQHPVLILKEISHSDLQSILEFIYVGEVSVEQDALQSFLKAAQSLQIKGLSEDLDHNSEKSLAPCHKEDADINGHSNVLKNEEPEVTEPRGAVQLVLQQSHRSRKKRKPSKRPLHHPSSSPLTNPELSGRSNAVDSMEETEELEIDDREEEEIAEVKRRESKDTVTSSGLFMTHLENSATSNDREEQDEEEEEEALDIETAFNTSGPVSEAKNSKNQKKTCPYCFQQLSWHALSRHIRDMHRAQEAMVHCSFCGKKFRNKNSLGCHIWRFHKTSKDEQGNKKHDQKQTF